MKKTLKQDLSSSLGEVSRWYIRKPATIILTIFMLIFIIPFAIFLSWLNVFNGFTLECWKGKNN